MNNEFFKLIPMINQEMTIYQLRNTNIFSKFIYIMFTQKELTHKSDY